MDVKTHSSSSMPLENISNGWLNPPWSFMPPFLLEDCVDRLDCLLLNDPVSDGAMPVPVTFVDKPALGAGKGGIGGISRRSGKDWSRT